MKYFRLLFVLLVSFFVLAPIAQSAYVSQTDTPRITEPVVGDAFVAGDKVTTDANVSGDFFALSPTIEINQKIERSIFAFGQDVTITGASGYNAFVFADIIRLKGTIDHDVYIFAREIRIEDTAQIKGDVSLFANTISLAGTIGGSVSIHASDVTSSATIGKDFTSYSRNLAFTGGSVGGDLTYEAQETARGLDTVTITGQTHFKQVATDGSANAFRSFLYSVLMLFVTGAALLLLVPKKVQGVVREFTARWGVSFLYGIIAFILIPLACVFLVATVVGIPLAVIGIALYVVLLIAAVSMSYIIVGEMALRMLKTRNNNTWYSLISGVLVVSLVFLIPQIGDLLQVVFFVGVILPTFGASLLWWRQSMNTLSK